MRDTDTSLFVFQSSLWLYVSISSRYQNYAYLAVSSFNSASSHADYGFHSRLGYLFMSNDNKTGYL